jgi:hypothetical protein
LGLALPRNLPALQRAADSGARPHNDGRAARWLVPSLPERRILRSGPNSSRRSRRLGLAMANSSHWFGARSVPNQPRLITTPGRSEPARPASGLRWLDQRRVRRQRVGRPNSYDLSGRGDGHTPQERASAVECAANNGLQFPRTFSAFPHPRPQLHIAQKSGRPKMWRHSKLYLPYTLKMTGRDCFATSAPLTYGLPANCQLRDCWTARG